MDREQMAANRRAKAANEQGAGSPRIPLTGFGFFQSLLLAVAAGFLVFFLATTLAIFALLAWNLAGGHTVNYADSYRYIGLPAGIAALAAALVFFAALWMRGKIRN